MLCVPAIPPASETESCYELTTGFAMPMAYFLVCSARKLPHSVPPFIYGWTEHFLLSTKWARHQMRKDLVTDMCDAGMPRERFPDGTHLDPG